MNTYAVVTGASQGLGKYIAIELAKRKYNLLLLARSGDKLEALKAEWTKSYGIEVLVYSIDLSTEEAIPALNYYCTAQNLSIGILINNAGYGLWGDFEMLGLQDQRNMINLNVNALTALTYMLLPFLKKNKSAYILQIASTAAYQAVPTLAVYAATKAYVLSFSRSLYHELKPLGIQVSCLCPGPMDTGFTDRAGMQALAHLSKQYNMDPEVVARQAVKNMLAGQLEIVPGFLNKLQKFGDWLLPKKLVERVAARLYKIR
ncbi:SDR family oxidoreductase [Olivibacter ginsenosidimutans]|uniref:SDR family oxidoreductase n=1 Tax=Olivibacter ginsenosidimutans TaxID=1176537 RepID=A0ABP9AW37_9SPHI